MFSVVAALFFVVVGNLYAVQLVMYPIDADHEGDGKVVGTINGQPAPFEHQHTYHPESANTKGFKTNYIRFAADGPVDVSLTVSATITNAYLRTVGKDLPFNRSGSNFQFTLPGPGHYYLQLPDLNQSGQKTYTVVFFFDDLTLYNSYQQIFASAKNALNYGIISSYSSNQTSAIQSLLNSRGAIYFPTGIYRTGKLTINSDTTIYLAQGAVLKGIDNYNTNPYLYVNGNNIKISGLGTIDANALTSGNIPTKIHGIDMNSCTNLVLENFIIKDSNSWMLHIQKCNNINFDGVKVFSGKDGVDPDGSVDVMIKNMFIQSIDDGFAVKSKYSGRNCERVTMRDCIVFSVASSLKIGTENYYGYVKDITWDNCDAVDADRGCIVYTNKDDGYATIQNITWRNIRIFNYPWSAETGGAPFQFDRRLDCVVSNLLLENIVVYPKIGCYVNGIGGITFRNIIMNGSSNMYTPSNYFEGVIWPGVTSQSKPIVFISPSSRNQNEYCNGDFVTVTVQHPFSKAITAVELLVDDVSKGIVTASPYKFTLSGISNGEHTLKARASDSDGAINTTAPLKIKIVQDNTVIKGDCNCDGSVTPGDALMGFQFYLRLLTPATTPCDQTAAADMDSNGSLTPGDALCIFKKYLNDPC